MITQLEQHLKNKDSALTEVSSSLLQSKRLFSVDGMEMAGLFKSIIPTVTSIVLQ